jgi:hypothetical protein
MLGERCGIRVIIDVDRHTEPFCHHVGERNIAQCEIYSEHGPAGALIDQAWNPEPDGLNLCAVAVTGLLHGVDRDVEKRALVEADHATLGTAVN